MRNARLVTLCAAVAFAATACTQATSSEQLPSTAAPIVTVDGTSYTCNELLGAYPGACDSPGTYVLATYGHNIDQYVSSSGLGVLGNVPFNNYDRAFIGVTTCALARDRVGFSGLIDRVFRVAPFGDIPQLQASDLRPAWNAALKQLCPK